MNETNNMNTEPTITVDLEVLAREVAQPVLLTQPAQPKKRGRPEKISKDMFTEAWNNCNSLKEVSELLGVPALSASVKASNLRKTGRNLKMYKRSILLNHVHLLRQNQSNLQLVVSILLSPLLKLKL